jgi:hypothetical protein
VVRDTRSPPPGTRDHAQWRMRSDRLALKPITFAHSLICVLRNEDQSGIERRRRTLRIIAAIMIGAASALLVMVGVGVALVTLVANDFLHVESRPRLNPIPVAATACPQVRIIHLTADSFQLALGSAQSCGCRIFVRVG